MTLFEISVIGLVAMFFGLTMFFLVSTILERKSKSKLRNIIQEGSITTIVIKGAMKYEDILESLQSRSKAVKG